MGYSERVCQICGISFKVGRSRTKDEPQDAGWASYGGDYVVDEDPSDPCQAQGCENIDHEGSEEKEHIAGPKCTCTGGYAGSRISVEEMRDITACVCLHPKASDWEPESDDEDFAKEAFSCFVTGASKDGTDEFDVSGLEPAKHDVEDCMIGNHLMEERLDWKDIGEEDGAMPMHPKCFEIFKKASLRKFGKVDIDGLFLLRDDLNDIDDVEMTRFAKFPQGTDLGIVIEQWYYHEPGTEYLAANPVDIPGLRVLLDDRRGTRSELVFDQINEKDSTDPFAALSAELRLMILERLGRRDVANLRLASPFFSQLPQSYFHSLILHEMPWLWEAHALSDEARSIDWHKLWLALHAADGGDLSDEKERAWLKKVRGEAYQRIQKGLEERNIHWGNEEYHKTFREGGPNYDEQCDREVHEAYASGKWPGKKATEILGLRNRRRVWTDCQEILRRIAVKNERGEREKLGSPEE